MQTIAPEEGDVTKKADIIFAAKNLEHKFSGVSADTAETVAFWVNKLLKTKLNHLCSSEQLTITLIFENTQFVPAQFNDLSYQNNKKTIKMMATVLLENIKRHRDKEAIRYQTLLINSAYFGSGKTRLGVEFLSQFKLLLKNNPEWRKQLEEQYFPKDIQQLTQSKVVYVDCRKLQVIDNNLSKTFLSLKAQIDVFLKGSIEKTPCFVILDEIGVLVSKYKPIPIQGIHQQFTSMYSVISEFVLPFQEITTVSLYVCGKGAFMDILGTGRLRPVLQSPTIIKSIHLEAFSEKDMLVTMKKTHRTSLLTTHLENNGLLDYFIHKVNEETRGVPYFVVHYILRGDYFHCLSKDDIDKQILLTRSSIPPSFLIPFEQFSNQPLLSKIYHTLLFAGIVGMEIDITNFKVYSFFAELDTKDTEFEGISSLTMLDISSILNCYLHPVGNKFKLLFPQAIIQSYLDDYSKSKPHYDISWLVNEHSTVMSSSDTLEHLTRTLLRFKMAWGTAQQSKIGEVFPFLSKTSVTEIPCYNLDTLNCNKKLMRATKSNKQGWESVIRKLKGTGKLGYFYDSSHSPDEFWNVATASTETYIEIQDKNLQGESFNLNEEIEKNEKVRLVVGDEVKLILLFMMRSGSSLAGTYDGGVVVNGITLHKNTTVSNVNPKKKN